MLAPSQSIEHSLEGRAKLDEFLAARPNLLYTAFRILHDPVEAEDIVQEVWLRWQLVRHDAVRSSKALLMTITARLAINVLRSGRKRYEYPTADFRERDLTDEATPAYLAELHDSVADGILTLLERLTARENAAYLLREVFEYSYPEIADILGGSQAHVRQLVHRARVSICIEKSHKVSVEDYRDLLAAFTHAASLGEMCYLERVLASQIECGD